MPITISVPRWTMAEQTGYEPKTTFWQDFSIAEHFGAAAVKDTYKRAWRDWRHDIVYLTELVMVLNHKISYWYCTAEKYEGQPRGRACMGLCRLYDKLWREADAWCYENLQCDDAKYYFETTD